MMSDNLDYFLCSIQNMAAIHNAVFGLEDLEKNFFPKFYKGEVSPEEAFKYLDLHDVWTNRIKVAYNYPNIGES